MGILSDSKKISRCVIEANIPELAGENVEDKLEKSNISRLRDIYGSLGSFFSLSPDHESTQCLIMLRAKVQGVLSRKSKGAVDEGYTVY